ncbi:MAG TPA: deoxyribodipyrimidine photo-lyase [Telluria sp.]|nr:deoxyribodipyrimidine photo-lyase [Telluria sp.]
MRYPASLVWFRRDLRTFDHAALFHALTASNVVYCVFIYDDAILSSLPRADRRVEFIHGAVAELDRELRALGGHLLAARGVAQERLPALAAQLGVDAVFTNEDYEPQARARDAAVARALQADGRAFHAVKDQVVFARDEVLTQAGEPFSVFTPYRRAWQARLARDPAVLAPFDTHAHAARLAPPPGPPALPSLEELGFERTNLAALGITPGAAAGAALFEDFLGRIAQYDVARDFPARKGPSYLSVHLRFGTVSIRQLARSAHELAASGAGGAGAATWLSELVWREFYQMILWHHPRVVSASFKPAYDAIAWEQGPQAEELFAAWCAGRTGYPLVDAAMRQLNTTGYMHNRLRMVAASFLTKDLGLDWRRGERYFAQQLNDYDLAANNGGWQWAASCGCDAQPWFRIFNPVTQSERFDPDGKFILRYVPELAGLKGKALHAPWLAGGKAGYPAPIVAHDEARRLTLARYAVVRQAA